MTDSGGARSVARWSMKMRLRRLSGSATLTFATSAPLLRGNL